MADSLKSYAGESKYYDIKDLAEILGKNEEQVRRDFRQGKIPGRLPLEKKVRFLKKTVNDWLEDGQPVLWIPPSPLMIEAEKLCEGKDHGWLLDEQYKGIAYLSKESVAWQSENIITVGYKHVCYFCGESVDISI